MLRSLAGAALAALLLAGCQADELSLGSGPKHLRQISSATRAEMSELGMSTGAPVLMRIFKEESAFEVWKKDRTGRYALLKSYEICKWSGDVGPKIKEGDRQAPEGYYTITPGLMNPNSSYYLAFNTGYPNAYDRSHGRTGSHLMVHGACSSRGCYAMSDEQIQEIYALARDAFRGGQTGFQLAAYPFRMTPENMARHIDSPHMPFWRMLKEGYDHFELTRQEPKVDVCGRKYVFNVTADGPMSPATACPALVQPEALRVAAAKKAAEDDAQIVVIAARLEEERRAAEDKAIMLAGLEEDRLRRAEERRVALAGRTQEFASLFGLGGTPAAPAAPAPVMPVLPAVADDGVPLPRPAPRETVLALVPVAEPAAPDSIFSRLMPFGGGEPPPATASATVPADPPVTGAAGPEMASAAPLACAPGDTEAMAACAGTGAVPPATSGAAVQVDENRSILGRIGNWF